MSALKGRVFEKHAILHRLLRYQSVGIKHLLQAPASRTDKVVERSFAPGSARPESERSAGFSLDVRWWWRLSLPCSHTEYRQNGFLCTTSGISAPLDPFFAHSCLVSRASSSRSAVRRAPAEAVAPLIRWVTKPISISSRYFQGRAGQSQFCQISAGPDTGCLHR